jgi:hypothetical protein
MLSGLHALRSEDLRARHPNEPLDHHGEQGRSPATAYFTFSNAQKSEKVGAISEPLAVLLLAYSPTPHFFTFSLFHPSASSKLHMLAPNVALRGSQTPGR